MSFSPDYTNMLSNHLSSINKNEERHRAYIFIMFVFIFLFFTLSWACFYVRACVRVCVLNESNSIIFLLAFPPPTPSPSFNESVCPIIARFHCGARLQKSDVFLFVLTYYDVFSILFWHLERLSTRLPRDSARCWSISSVCCTRRNNKKQKATKEANVQFQMKMLKLGNEPQA